MDVRDTINKVYKEHYKSILSILVAKFGYQNKQLIEDSIHEAFISAIRTWPIETVPSNTRSWLLKVSKNKIIDGIRKDQKIDLGLSENEVSNLLHENPLEFEDDDINMMFACCHPDLTQIERVIVTLKFVSKLSNEQIATAFLAKKTNIDQKIVRAKRKLLQKKIILEVPEGQELISRLDTVLDTIYSLFNEGYSSQSSEQYLNKDICFEAIRLCLVLVNNTKTNSGKSRGLLALMLLHGSRFDARLDSGGNIITLDKQDRSLWNDTMIEMGMYYLQSISNYDISEFHLQANIAAAYCLAENYEKTDWSFILKQYDILLTVNPSPIIKLNRAIVVSFINGPQEAIDALESLKDDESLKRYYLYYITKGDMYLKRKDYKNAEYNFNYGLKYVKSSKIKSLINEKLQQCVQ
jgi:RNA polymerase sigma-70 factor (ECF subfamily)